MVYVAVAYSVSKKRQIYIELTAAWPIIQRNETSKTENLITFNFTIYEMIAGTGNDWLA